MKIVVSDFDLTFFDYDYDENIKIVNNFIDKGNVFIIATGRSVELLKKDIENRNIKFRYLICSDGAVILDENLNIINSVVFEPNTINEIIQLLKNDSELTFLDIDKNSDGISGVYASFNDLQHAKEVLNYIVNKYDVSGYLSTHGIKIINKNVSKASGIEYIQKILNANDNSIYTIGDHVNDLEMINKYNGYLIGKQINNFKEFIKNIDN